MSQIGNSQFQVDGVVHTCASILSVGRILDIAYESDVRAFLK